VTGKALGGREVPRTVLDVLEVRLLSALLAVGAVIGILLLRQLGLSLRGPQEVRASVPMPRVLEVLWPAVVNLPTVAVFAGAGWPELLYATPLHVSFPGDTAIQVLGFVAFGIGGLLALQAFRHLGKHMVVQIAVARDHRLVTSGPYARIRHPAYTGAILLSVGAGLFFLNLVFLVNLVLVVALATYRARLEERLLSSPQGFGLQYRAYVARTGRFLPRLR